MTIDSSGMMPGTQPERSPFIGRLAELASLRQSWLKVVDGERQVIFVSGEPGIGKTRLASQLAEEVRKEEGAVLAGRCDEEALIAYQPFVEALRGHLDQSSGDFSSPEVSPLISDLSRLLPELATRKRVMEKRSDGDREAERYRLFEAVTSFLASVSHDRPTLIILDDLQWADKASLLLLRHVIRSPRKAKLLLLGTYRDVLPSAANTRKPSRSSSS